MARHLKGVHGHWTTATAGICADMMRHAEVGMPLGGTRLPGCLVDRRHPQAGVRLCRVQPSWIFERVNRGELTEKDGSSQPAVQKDERLEVS